MKTKPSTFGSRLKAARDKKGMTQAALADRSGIAVQHISNYECGLRVNPTLDTVQRIAAALEIAAIDLLDEKILAVQVK